MVCPSCNIYHVEDKNFCEYCGARLRRPLVREVLIAASVVALAFIAGYILVAGASGPTGRAGIYRTPLPAAEPPAQVTGYVKGGAPGLRGDAPSRHAAPAVHTDAGAARRPLTTRVARPAQSRDEEKVAAAVLPETHGSYESKSQSAPAPVEQKPAVRAKEFGLIRDPLKISDEASGG